MKKILLIIVAAVICAVGFVACSTPASAPSNAPTAAASEVPAETKAPATIAPTEQAPATQAASAEASQNPDVKTATISGEVTDGTNSSIRIKAEDGKEYTFTKDGAKTDLKDGIIIGNQVTIEYSGDLECPKAIHISDK